MNPRILPIELSFEDFNDSFELTYQVDFKIEKCLHVLSFRSKFLLHVLGRDSVENLVYEFKLARRGHEIEETWQFMATFEEYGWLYFVFFRRLNNEIT